MTTITSARVPAPESLTADGPHRQPPHIGQEPHPAVVTEVSPRVDPGPSQTHGTPGLSAARMYGCQGRRQNVPLGVDVQRKGPD